MVEKKPSWFKRVLRRLHQRLDAIFILCFLGFMAAFLYYVHYDGIPVFQMQGH